MAWTGATCARPGRRDVAIPKRNGRDELCDSQSSFQSGAGSRRARDLCCRAFQLDRRLRDSPAMRRTVLDVTHRRRGAMAFAPSDGIPAADAMVATGCSSDAQGSHIRRQRQLRLRSCRRRTMGSASVSERGMTTPRFWTVSFALTSLALLWQFRAGWEDSPAAMPDILTAASRRCEEARDDGATDFRQCWPGWPGVRRRHHRPAALMRRCCR